MVLMSLSLENAYCEPHASRRHGTSISRTDKMHQINEAHQHLMSISTEGVRIFGPFQSSSTLQSHVNDALTNRNVAQTG